jgi:hypothetical protein
LRPLAFASIVTPYIAAVIVSWRWRSVTHIALDRHVIIHVSA